MAISNKFVSFLLEEEYGLINQVVVARFSLS